jgi:hypothetical protein
LSFLRKKGGERARTDKFILGWKEAQWEDEWRTSGGRLFYKARGSLMERPVSNFEARIDGRTIKRDKRRRTLWMVACKTKKRTKDDQNCVFYAWKTKHYMEYSDLFWANEEVEE